MSNVGYDTFFPKTKNTKFVVKNITKGTKREKTVKIFQYPIKAGSERDLLTIPYVSEADIRHALLKGDLRIKLEVGEVIVVDSNIDLLQFDSEQKSFLQSVGIVNGLEVTAFGSGTLTDTQHARLRQLVHLTDSGGPWEEFDSGAFKETLPLGDPFPTGIIWWTSSAKLNKIVEKAIVYDGSSRVISVEWKAYDANGILLATITDTISYVGTTPFESTRTRTIS